MKRKILSILTALALCLSLLPAPALAAEGGNLVTGRLVLDPVYSTLLSDYTGPGYTWDSESKTLTLENFHQQCSNTDYEGILLPPGSTVVLKGTNTFALGSSAVCAIAQRRESSDLTLQCEPGGTMEVTSGSPKFGIMRTSGGSIKITGDGRPAGMDAEKGISYSYLVDTYGNPITSLEPVAEITTADGKTIPSLTVHAAFDSQYSGATIKLLKEVKVPYQISFSGTFEFDGGSHTISADEALFTVNTNSSLTLLGGTLTAHNPVRVQGNGSLTVPEGANPQLIATGEREAGGALTGKAALYFDSTSNVRLCGGTYSGPNAAISMPSAGKLSKFLGEGYFFFKNDEVLDGNTHTLYSDGIAAGGSIHSPIIVKKCEHQFGDWSMTDSSHSRSCSVCKTEETGAHTFESGVCTVCGYSEGTHIHTFSNWTESQENGVHKKERTCGACQRTQSLTYTPQVNLECGGAGMGVSKTYTLEVAAAGFEADEVYFQWQEYFDNPLKPDNWLNISGETGSSYTNSGLFMSATSKQYRVVVTIGGETVNIDFTVTGVACLHTDATYTDNGDGTHTWNCPKCGESKTEKHQFSADQLSCACGAKAVAKAEADGETTFYITAAEAWNAAKAAGTAKITLLANATLPASLSTHYTPENAASGVPCPDITFDGGAFTLTGAPGSRIFDLYGGILTITGGRFKEVPDDKGRTAGCVNVNGGSTLTVTDGILEGAETGGGTGLSVTNSTVRLTGGTFKGNSAAIRCYGGLHLSDLLSSVDEKPCVYYSGDTPVKLEENQTALTGPVTVKVCGHEEANTCNGVCPYCGTTFSQPHKWDSTGLCENCGAQAVAKAEADGETTYHDSLGEALEAAAGKTATVTQLTRDQVPALLEVESGDDITLVNGNIFGMITVSGGRFQMKDSVISMQYPGTICAVLVTGGDAAIANSTITGTGSGVNEEGTPHIGCGMMVYGGGVTVEDSQITGIGMNNALGIGVVTSEGEVTMTGSTASGGGTIGSGMSVVGGIVHIQKSKVQAGALAGIGLQVNSGAKVDISESTLSGPNNAVSCTGEDSVYSVGSLLLNYGQDVEPHYAYFDESGNPADSRDVNLPGGTFKVGECKHDGVEITANGDGSHSLACPYCGTNFTHRTVLAISDGTVSGSCDKCGYLIKFGAAALEQLEYTYDGTEKEPGVTIPGLTEGTDFTVSYENNKDAGTGKAIVKGIGGYAGEFTLEFTIKGTVGPDNPDPDKPDNPDPDKPDNPDPDKPDKPDPDNPDKPDPDNPDKPDPDNPDKPDPDNPDKPGDVEIRLDVKLGISEVPSGLRELEHLNSPEKIDLAMRAAITQMGVPSGNCAVYDVTLMVSTDGGKTWTKATESNFPSTGLTVTLPYPAGTGRDTHIFSVVHMFTSSLFGKTPGDTERPAVENTAEGLRFTVTGLSPISIGWQEIQTPPIPPEPPFQPTWPVGPSMPSGGSGESVSVNTYAVKVEEGARSKVTSNRVNAASGSSVTLTVTPEDGFELDTLTVVDSRGNKIRLTPQGGGKYTFTMPGRAVTVKATFAPLPADVERPCDGGAVCPSRAYADLNTGIWYHEAVDYVIQEGLLTGYNDGTFKPNGNLTRAQLAQILYNMAGRPAVTDGSVFTDVAVGQWYSPAVAWAAENGIVGGYGNGLFGPDDGITREQLATMLWRYAGSPAAMDKELHFSDADRASGYALDALRWAAENGVLGGYSDGRLDPGGPATRAQVAQMLKNFFGDR